jgi:hypothetical protein
MPLRVGLLSSLLCAVASVADARNAIQVTFPNGQIAVLLLAVSGKQAAIVYPVTLSHKRSIPWRQSRAATYESENQLVLRNSCGCKAGIN